MSLCYLTIFPLFILIFLQQDPDDLPFKKGETLTIISKDEEQWWTARNSLGQTGSVPVPYITVVRKIKFSPVLVNQNNLLCCYTVMHSGFYFCDTLSDNICCTKIVFLPHLHSHNHILSITSLSIFSFNIRI